MAAATPSEEIDAIIAMHTDWRGKMLADLRKAIVQTDPRITEMTKWKKPSKPEGVAVWFFGGNLCMADVLKNAVRLNFQKGIKISDPTKQFNARLDSSGIRAIDYFEGDKVDTDALQAIVRQAVALNE